MTKNQRNIGPKSALKWAGNEPNSVLKWVENEPKWAAKKLTFRSGSWISMYVLPVSGSFCMMTVLWMTVKRAREERVTACMSSCLRTTGLQVQVQQYVNFGNLVNTTEHIWTVYSDLNSSSIRLSDGRSTAGKRSKLWSVKLLSGVFWKDICQKDCSCQVCWRTTPAIEMFSRIAIFKPALKCIYGRSGRAFLCDIRKFSDTAIDRQLHESYVGFMPRLIVCSVNLFLQQKFLQQIKRSLDFKSRILYSFTTLQSTSISYFTSEQDVMQPDKWEAIKKIMTDEIVSVHRPLTAVMIYAGSYYLPLGNCLFCLTISLGTCVKSSCLISS